MAFNSGGGGGLADAADVAFSATQSNDFLRYDANTNKWGNTAIVGISALANGGGRETVWANYSASGAVTLDLASGNIFRITLMDDVTLSFTGAVNNSGCSFSLYVKQNTNSKSIMWPVDVLWPDGIAPTLSAVAGAIDILVFESITGGAEWYGALAGGNFKRAA